MASHCFRISWVYLLTMHMFYTTCDLQLLVMMVLLVLISNFIKNQIKHAIESIISKQFEFTNNKSNQSFWYPNNQSEDSKLDETPQNRGCQLCTRSKDRNICQQCSKCKKHACKEHSKELVLW